MRPALIVFLLMWCATLARAQNRMEWIPLDGKSEPGTPVRVGVSKVGQDGTTFEVNVPGVWMETVQYADRSFTRLLLPAVQLEGVGLPRQPGERGWYDFPAESGIPPLPIERFRNALSVGVAKPIYPIEQLDAKPRTGAEMERLKIDPAGARPGIPTLRGFVAVSRANTREDLALSIEEERTTTLQLRSPLVPAGYEGLDQEAPREGYIPPQLVDEEFYESFKGEYRGTEQPLSEVSGAGSGFATLEARLPLVAYTSAQTVEVLTQALIFVKHLKGTEDFECPIGWDVWTSVFPFINGAALREAFTVKGIRIESSRSAHYLIVTPSEYRDELNTFALWKQAKGLNVDFAYVGTDVAADRAAIDKYLEEYFQKNYCHGVYVLLVGDVDVIPTGRSSRINASPDGADGDADHVYEVLGNDRFPSMYVGRLSVNSSDELVVQLNKILEYERSPTVGDWPTEATLAANSENDDGTRGVSASFPSKYAQAVNQIATYGSYHSPPTFQRLHAGAASAAATRAVNQDVIDAIDEGRGHVLYRGHGGGTSWLAGWDGSSSSGSSWTGTQIAALDNAVDPIVYSIACQNARLRNNDSIAETWMSSQQGAVAHYGASVNSYTTENHERAKGIFRAIYESDFTRLGPAIAEAERISHSATGGGSSWDNNTFCYNLLGDPELTIRKKAVKRLFLTAVLNVSTAGLLVKVADQEGTPQPGAFANVTFTDGTSMNGFANPNSELLLPAVQKAQVAFVDLQADGYPSTKQRTEGRQWIPLEPNAQPGTPITVTLREVTQTDTTLALKIPGVWLATQEYGGREVSVLEFPDLADMTGPGIPKEGERGWYDFPAETGIAPLPAARYQRPFEKGVFQPVFPEGALGKAPRTAEEMRELGVDPAGARPGIPTLRGFLAVSRQSGRADLSIDFANSKQMDVRLPAPLKPAGFTGSDQEAARFGYPGPELFDEEFYAKFDGPYRGPETPIEPAGTVGAFGAAEVNMALVELAEINLAKIYTELLVNIKHLKGTEDFECPFSWDSWLFHLPFINGAALRESMTTKGIRIQGSRSAHYLILTPREYRDELNEFALWKQAKGLNVDFAYVPEDVAATRAAVDAYIEAYFKENYCHGVYVLLVGDLDVIPSGRSTRIDASPDFSDGDSDHVYEVLGSDRFPSMYVGRLSVNSAEELTTQLAKILSYERNPASGDWPTRATLAANSENDDGSRGVSASFPSKYAQAVNQTASFGGYVNPPTFEVLHAGASSAAGDRAVNQDVTDAIQAGRGMVLYRGHGDGNSWVAGWDGSSSYGSAWTSTLVSNLEHNAFPIVFSIACQNARLRNNDSIAERWLSHDDGAVAHFGASVNSYTSENHERTKGIFRAFYQCGFNRLAPGIAEGERISYTATGGGGGWDNNTFCYNLLGDPELTVRKKPVLRLSLVAQLAVANLGTLVRVTDEQGAIVSGGFVKATLADGTSVNGFTNERGEFTAPSVRPDQIALLDLHADGYNAARQSTSQGERQWVPLQPDAKPEDPVVAQIEELDETTTSFTLKIPGYWIRTEMFGGREVSVLEFPEIARLSGPGIPTREGERGWYDFPEETGIPPIPVERYAHPFEQGVFQPIFPESALGSSPKSEREMIALGINPAGARPGIPTMRGFVAVSRQTTREDLTISFDGSEMREVQLPAPLKPAGFSGQDVIAPREEGYLAPELFDEEFYAQFAGRYSGPEPSLEVLGSAGAFGVAQVNVPLVEATRPELVNVFSTLKVYVKHLKGPQDFACPLAWDSWIFNLPFINGDALRDSMTAKGIRIEGSRSAHYLIITPREYRDELDEFALWKQSKGLNVDFAYVPEDLAATRAAIDAYIEAYFKENYCHGVYVLLVGDVDKLPSGRSSRIIAGPDEADGDSDHVYEVLGSDRLPSMYVGRLSVDSAEDLKTQLAKILSYEKNPAAGDWPRRATLAANSENDDGTRGVSASFPSKYAKAVNQTVAFGGYVNPPIFEVLHAGASSAAADRAVNQDVTDAIADGRGIVLYRGHGNGSSWAAGWDGSSVNGTAWTSTLVNNLDNRAYPIVFSIACQNARLRNTDAIGEVWLNHERGAVAHFGASVNSYTTENHERTKGLFRAIYQAGFTRLAPAIAHGECISLIATGGGSGWDNNTFCYNLLGDPELTIRKKAVPLTLVLVPGLFQIETGVQLTLADSDKAVVPGALVNVELANGDKTNLFTNLRGQLLLAGLRAEEISRLQIHADGFEFTELDLNVSTSATLRPLGFARTGEFNVEANVTGGPWTIQGSADLRTWNDLGVLNDGTQVFQDPNAGQFRHRYYRATRQ